MVTMIWADVGRVMTAASNQDYHNGVLAVHPA
jgi:hypothetical protein